MSIFAEVSSAPVSFLVNVGSSALGGFSPLLDVLANLLDNNPLPDDLLLLVPEKEQEVWGRQRV
jgi:hypothetical protein